MRLTLTEKGEDLRDAYAPGDTMHALYEDRPGYSEVFNAMLWACSSEDGASRDEIEAQINELPPLQPNEEGHKTVYPQYFFDALETAGGIGVARRCLEDYGGRASALVGACCSTASAAWIEAHVHRYATPQSALQLTHYSNRD